MLISFRRLFHRSFRHKSQLTHLTETVKTFPSSCVPLETRTCDEIVNAFTRVGGIEEGLRSLEALRSEFEDGGLIISSGVLTNLFISFDRGSRVFSRSVDSHTPERFVNRLETTKSLIKLQMLKEKATFRSKMDQSHWVTLIAIFLVGGDVVEATKIIHLLSSTGTTDEELCTLAELAVICAFDTELTILTSDGLRTRDQLEELLASTEEALISSLDTRNNENNHSNIKGVLVQKSISSVLQSVVSSTKITTSGRNMRMKTRQRKACDLSVVVDFAEELNSLSSEGVFSCAFRLSFLEMLFVESVESRLLAQGARLVRLLDGLCTSSRYQKGLLAQEGTVAATGRRWVARLLGTSLQHKKSTVLSNAIKLLRTKSVSEPSGL